MNIEEIEAEAKAGEAMTLRGRARKICARGLGMHEYSAAERRIIDEYRVLTAIAHRLTGEWRAGKIAREDIAAAIESADDPESLRECLNIAREALQK